MRRHFRAGGAFESMAGYARAVRHGNLIAVSGTAALGEDGEVLFPGDARAQTREALERALAAVAELGGSRDDVIRTRLLLSPGCDWQGAVHAHRELLAGVDPANTTYYVGGFIPADVLVEVEVDAVVADAPG